MHEVVDQENSPNGSYIRFENLCCVIQHTVELRRQWEKDSGYQGKSAFLAGLEDNLDYMKKYGKIEIRY